MIERELTKKQQSFVDHYVATLNATVSYMRAYKIDNENVAGVSGHRLLKNDKVMAEIESRMEEIKNKRIASAEEVLEYLTSTMMDSNLKPEARTRAAELLGKRHKLFTDKVEMDTNMEVEINLDGFDQENNEE